MAQNTVESILSKHLRDKRKNMLASDRCLLNTGTVQCIFLFRELTTYLLNTGCLLNRSSHYDRFYCNTLPVFVLDFLFYIG